MQFSIEETLFSCHGLAGELPGQVQISEKKVLESQDKLLGNLRPLLGRHVGQARSPGETTWGRTPILSNCCVNCAFAMVHDLLWVKPSFCDENPLILHADAYVNSDGDIVAPVRPKIWANTWHCHTPHSLIASSGAIL